MIICGQKVRLRPKKLSDAFNDYLWLQDEELARLDARSPLASHFQDYFLAYAEELLGSTYRQSRFAIETLDGKYIGSCSYSHSGRKEVEVGIMIGDRTFWNQGYGSDALNALIHYLFEEEKVERIYLKTLDWNVRAQKCFQKCGFVPCRRFIQGKHSFLAMEIHRAKTKT